MKFTVIVVGIVFYICLANGYTLHSRDAKHSGKWLAFTQKKNLISGKGQELSLSIMCQSKLTV